MSLTAKINESLGKTRAKMAQAFQAVFLKGAAPDWDGLEEALLLADVGGETAGAIVAGVRAKKSADPMAALREELIGILDLASPDLPVKVFVGINGSGKTTSLGKLGFALARAGKRVYVIGTDTFRAAADRQLEQWCRRAQIPCLLGKAGSDPASVLFDGLASAEGKKADYVLVDTAGRLHSNKNLMQELAKIMGVGRRVRPEGLETLLTLDAATGQNALQQMEIFQQAAQPSGLILTKLDGSAKGGIAVALAAKYGIPIKYVGTGEGPADLLPFRAQDYVDSLLPQKE